MRWLTFVLLAGVMLVLAAGCGGEGPSRQAQHLSLVLGELLPAATDLPGFTISGTVETSAVQSAVEKALPGDPLAIGTVVLQQEGQSAAAVLAVMSNEEESREAVRGGFRAAIYRDLVGDPEALITRGERRDNLGVGDEEWAQEVTLSTVEGVRSGEFLAFARGPVVAVVWTVASGDGRPPSSLDLARLLEERIDRELAGVSS